MAAMAGVAGTAGAASRKGDEQMTYFSLLGLLTKGVERREPRRATLFKLHLNQSTELGQTGAAGAGANSVEMETMPKE